MRVKSRVFFVILASLVLLPQVALSQDIGSFSRSELKALRLKCFKSEMGDMILSQTPSGRCEARIRKVTISYPDGFRHELDFSGPRGEAVQFENVRLPLLKNTRCLDRIAVDVQMDGRACDKVELFKLQARR